MPRLLTAALCTAALGAAFAGGTVGEQPRLDDFDFAGDRIQPYAANPYYWQYRGRPIVLLGGGPQHKLFQFRELLAVRDEPWRSETPDTLVEHLDFLKSVGANYVRNTMTHVREVDSDPSDDSVYPYAKNDDGLFDLNEWNDEYWQRLERFLQLTFERDIIVQIEFWDPFDYHHPWTDQAGWQEHPFNPPNNVNYTSEESKLPTEWADSPSDDSSREHPFTNTVPALDHKRLVLEFQERFVEKLLSISLNYPHVLHLVANEPNNKIEWDAYWAEFAKDVAAQAGMLIEIGNMRRENNLRSPEYRFVLDNPDTFTFTDISQNFWGSQTGDTHWERIVWARDRIAENPRPLTNVKIYGGTFDWTQGYQGGGERFWRNILAGSASARFHRDGGGGLGITPVAQAHIHSMRMMLEAVDITAGTPGNELLSDRAENEAYASARSGKSYVVYFPDGGTVGLDMAPGDYELRWLDVMESVWQGGEAIEGGTVVQLAAPGEGHWVAVARRLDR